VVNPLKPGDLMANINEFSRKIPPTGQSERLTGLLQALERHALPILPETHCWAHSDPNIRNLILSGDGVKMVD
jgi:hypothetical protein